MPDDPVREALAALEHARWAHWQRYVHDTAIHNADGSLTIQRELVERWERQIATDYGDLTEREKDSDRAEADKTLAGLRVTPIADRAKAAGLDVIGHMDFKGQLWVGKGDNDRLTLYADHDAAEAFIRK